MLEAHLDVAADLADGQLGRGSADELVADAERIGLGQRSAVLAAGSPERSEEIRLARARLSAPGLMGRLFKVMALVSASWPAPGGFA